MIELFLFVASVYHDQYGDTDGNGDQNKKICRMNIPQIS